MNALWLGWTIATGAAAALLYRFGVWRRWRSLFVWLCLIFWQSIICWIFRNSHLYFWAYYSFGVAEDVCEVWMMAQIACHLAPQYEPLQRILGRAVPQMALVIFGVFIVLSFSEPLPERARMVFCASRYDAAVSLAIFVALAITIGMAGLGRIQFTGETRFVAAGLFLEAFVACIESLITAYFSPLNALNIVRYCVYLLALIAFCLPFLTGFISLTRTHRAALHDFSKRSSDQCTH